MVNPRLGKSGLARRQRMQAPQNQTPKSHMILLCSHRRRQVVLRPRYRHGFRSMSSSAGTWTPPGHV